MDYRQTWGEHRVYFLDDDGQLIAVPAAWTDAIEPDPFVVIAAGRSYFRFEDLVRLVEFIRTRREADSRRKREQGKERSVK